MRGGSTAVEQGVRAFLTRSSRGATLWRPSERLAELGLCAAVTVVALLTITPWPVGAFQDDAMYTVLAKSLAEGNGYRFLNLPGAPHATHYPPGYPALLALLWSLWPRFPDNIVLFKFANAFLLGGVALGAYRFTRLRFDAPRQAALAVALIGTLSIVVLLITGVVMSEPLFMALLFPALLASERAADRGTLRAGAAAGTLLGLLTLVRTIAAFGIPAIALVLLLRRRFAALAMLVLTSAVCIVPWVLFVQLYQHEVAPALVGKFGSYGAWLAEGYRSGGIQFAWDVVKRNATELTATLSYYFLPIQATWPRLLLLGWVVTLAAVGTKRFARNAQASLAFVASYTLIVMLWPFEPARFVLALWPLWPLFMGCGALALWGSAKQHKLLQGAVVALCAVVALGSSWYNLTGFRKQWWVTVQRDAGVRAKPLVEWVARYTKPTDVISTEDDILVYLYTGRRSIPTTTYTAAERLQPLTDAQDLTVVQSLFDAYSPQWYVVGSKQGVRTADALGKTGRLQRVGFLPGLTLYQSTSP